MINSESNISELLDYMSNPKNQIAKEIPAYGSGGYIKFVSDPNNQIAISQISKFYGSGMVYIQADPEWLRNEALKVIECRRLQNTYLQAFVELKLKGIDKWLYSKFWWISKRKKFVKRIWLWWFKKKVEFIPFKKENIGFTVSGPGFILDKVRIYKNEYDLNIPFLGHYSIENYIASLKKESEVLNIYRD